jgi:hypothetical protein
MKNLQLLIIASLITLFSINSNAQVSFSGYLTDTSGYAVSNVDIHWYIDNAPDSGTVTTNANGYFTDFVFSNVSQSLIYFRFLNCTGSYVTDSMPFSSNQPNSTLYNLQYCNANSNNPNPNPVCNVSIYSYADADTFYLSPSVIDSTATYVWNINYGQTISNDMNTSYIHPFSSSLFVCLEATFPNGCVANYCDSIFNLNNTNPGCNIYFNFTNSGDTLSFTPSVIDSNATYSWSTSNSQVFSNDVFPTLIDSSNSSFNVCLTFTQNGCTSNYCSMVYVNTNPNPSYNSIGGQIIKMNSFADDAIVYLIQLDSSNSGLSLSAVDTAYTDQYGNFEFFNFDISKSYFVKATLVSSSVDFNNYLPTYYADTTNSTNSLGGLSWTNAIELSFSPSIATAHYASIYLISGNNPGGPGFVSGLVSQGAGMGLLPDYYTRGINSTLSNVQIMITDVNYNPIAFTYSNNDGEFLISNLAYGDYILKCDVPGIPSQSFNFTLSQTKESFDNIEVTVNSNEIVIELNTTSVNSMMMNNLKTYPNPVVNQLRIENFDVDLSQFIFEVYAFNGKLMETGKLSNDGIINFENFSKGMYLLQLKSENENYQFKIVK